MEEKPSLLIIGNSNVGKSSITKLLLKDASQFKGKIGKNPGSTLLIKPIDQKNIPYKIIDLPGFGYAKSSSQRREIHIKQQIVSHIEKNHKQYFYSLVVINILRIEDEFKKYFYDNKETIPLTFELISFLTEFSLPILIIINKIDKLSNFDKNKIIKFLIDTSKEYGLNLIHLEKFKGDYSEAIPFLDFSALKKQNLGKLKVTINDLLNNYKKLEI